VALQEWRGESVGQLLAWKEPLRSRAAGAFLLLAIGGVAACDDGSDGLRGTWVGEDHTGIPLTLTFGPGRSFSMVADGDDNILELVGDMRLEYEAIPELKPARLSIRVVQHDSVLGKIPFGVYRVARSRLVLCLVRTHHETIGGIPLGVSGFEWPDELTGQCSVLER